MPFRTKKQFDLLPLSVLKISVKWLQPKQGISFHNENLLGGSNFHAINLSQLETICSFSTVHIHSASHLVPNMWVQWSGGGACLLYNGEVRLLAHAITNTYLWILEFLILQAFTYPLIVCHCLHLQNCWNIIAFHNCSTVNLSLGSFTITYEFILKYHSYIVYYLGWHKDANVE